jgi:hypothetical protein
MRIETKEYETIKELKDVHPEIENYIIETVKSLMDYGMSEQEAFVAILKRFKKIIK